MNGLGLAQFLQAFGVGMSFRPLLQKPARLTNAYLADIENIKSAKTAMRLRRELQSISVRINKREAATPDEPPYLLLDPTRLPFYLYI